MPVKGRVVPFRLGGSFYRFTENIPTGISVDRYARLRFTVADWRHNVRRIMAGKDMTQGDLATAARVRPNTLSDALSGKTDPGIGTVQKIAQGLDVPLWALFCNEHDYALFSASLKRTEAEHDRAAAIKAEVQAQLAPMVDAIIAKIAGPEPAAKPEPGPQPVPATAKRRKHA